MLKNHPRGLLVAFFANMGERFGFYTMMAILVYYLQASYGLSGESAGYIYATFYFLIYGLALVGGFIADRTRNYKGTIFIGILTMLGGYALMALPGMGLYVAVAGLFVIAFGNGLFKGNLQAVVGQMYDNPKYSHLRDSAYSVFYMGINIGAFFAPSAASGIRNWYLESQNLGHNADLPSQCHQHLEGTLKDTETFQAAANEAFGGAVTDLTAFADQYIAAFATGYNYAFGIAAGAMLLSLVIYGIFQRVLPSVKRADGTGDIERVEMSPEEEKKRFIALGLVFGTVIFFWMAFHQNGLALTFFARDYTAKEVPAVTNMFFQIDSFLAIIAVILGLVFMIRRSSTPLVRVIGAALAVGGGYAVNYYYGTFTDSNLIEPEKFQHFNPIFIVFLTPVVVAMFSWMNKKGIEPSTPKKIGIGMFLAAGAFLLLLVGSMGLTSQAELDGAISPDRVSPYWLINTYLALTIAELFLSPMGISFVSKVSPPRYQGLMQGGWLGATALGNQLLFVGSFMYARFEVWQVWMVFIACCCIAATFIFSVMKKLEAVAK